MNWPVVRKSIRPGNGGWLDGRGWKDLINYTVVTVSLQIMV
jgi:hypothetical protein